MTQLLSPPTQQTPPTKAPASTTPPAAWPWLLYVSGVTDTSADGEGGPAVAPFVLFGAAGAAGDALAGVDLKDPEAVAQAVAERINASGGGRLYVALETAWCLSVSVSTTDLPRRDRRQLLDYRLEDRVPYAVEDLTVDYVNPGSASDGDLTLGVAVESQRLEGLLTALDEAGVELAAVSPATLLAGQALVEGVDGPDVDAASSNAADVWVVPCPSPGCGGAMEMLVFPPQTEREAKPSPVGWYGFGAGLNQGTTALGARPRALLEQTAQRYGRSLRVSLASSDPMLLATLRDLPQVADVAVVPRPVGYEGGVPAGDPWINLRRGVLDPGADRRLDERFRKVSIVVMVVLACLWLGLQVRGSRFAGAYTQAERTQAEVYREAVGPGRRLPVSFTRGLRAILDEQQAASGGGGGGAVGADLRLFETLRAIPEDLDVRITQMRIQADRVELVAQTASSADAGVLAEALSGTGPDGMVFRHDRSASAVDGADESGAVTVDLVGVPLRSAGRP